MDCSDYCKATEEMSMEKLVQLVSEVGNSFLKAYVPIVEKKKSLSYTQNKNLAEIRRSLCRVQFSAR
jgi:coproporphyrinogen III oxidase